MKRRIVRAIVMVTFIGLTRVFVPQAARAQSNCTNAPDDETMVEYFNVLSFEEAISVTVIDQGKQFLISLACPPPISPVLPPVEYKLQLFSADKVQVSSCQSGSAAIVLNKTKLKQKQVPFCADGFRCNFFIEFSNTETATVYSETEYQITMTNGNSTLIPQLDPAILPVCSNTINDCLVSNSCALSTESEGTLILCESEQCASQPNADHYGYNENVYFEAITR